MLTKGNAGDTKEDGAWTGYWDNLKVTLENGTVVLNETFAAENNSMDADGMTVASVYEIPKVVEEHWTVNGGVISTPVPEIPQNVTHTRTETFTANTTSNVAAKGPSSKPWLHCFLL